VDVPPPPGGPLTYESYVQSPPMSGMAVASLVTGILALVFNICVLSLSIPLAVLAVIFGFVAKSRANQGEVSGKGLAIAGIVCGCVVLGFLAIVGLIAAALFGVAVFFR
jgi:heme/copper-type cytochrome/quinol oxidase subunit 2